LITSISSGLPPQKIIFWFVSRVIDKLLRPSHTFNHFQAIKHSAILPGRVTDDILDVLEQYALQQDTVDYFGNDFNPP